MRLAGLVGIVSVVLGACAGRSERHEADDGAGSAGGSLGNGAGSNGTGSAGSSTGAAGSPSASDGSGDTGGSSDMTSTAGKSSVGLPTCLQPIDPGSCRGADPRFAFDPATLACVPFTYGGCQGNDNRFETQAACEAACVASLPAGCDRAGRLDGCPCTDASQCAGGCESGAYATTGECVPVSAGYCRSSCCAEGESVCWIDGEHLSGVR